MKTYVDVSKVKMKLMRAIGRRGVVSYVYMKRSLIKKWLSLPFIYVMQILMCYLFAMKIALLFFYGPNQV